MTPIADMITTMHENGTPIEMIILAVRTIELASTRHPPDATLEKRRAWDREYRRRKRDEEEQSTRHPPDIHPTADPALSLESKKEVILKEKKERKRVGHPLPPDWTPNDAHYAEGERRGMSRASVDSKADDLRCWAAANANRSITLKSNWDAAFMGWLRKEPMGQANGDRTSNYRTNTTPGRATAREADFLAAVGGGAIEQLRKGVSAGRDGKVSGGSDVAGGDGVELEPENRG